MAYKHESSHNHDNADTVYSVPVKAGKRTYFFDVKSTRGAKDYYISITESKRISNPDGSLTFDKHKIFLYKEDFQKFAEGLSEVVDYIKNTCFGGSLPVRNLEEEDDRNIY